MPSKLHALLFAQLKAIIAGFAWAVVSPPGQCSNLFCHAAVVCFGSQSELGRTPVL
jgi:hypothetical protein